jgi:hypothetical protein
MEQTITHLAHAALWMFFIGFVFAVIGVIATIRWIAGMITGAGKAVESGAQEVQRRIKG